MPTIGNFGRVRIARKGFTLIELLMVVTITSIMVGIAASRFHISEIAEAQLAGMQMMQDIDFVRTRALAARSLARVKFTNTTTPAYAGFLDTDGDSTVAETAAESQYLHGFGTRELPNNIVFGKGSVPGIPNDAANNAITFANNRVDFNSRGIVQPMGQGGVVYLQNSRKPGVVVAVEVSPAGNVRLWSYQNGSWK